jgi:hypothetical protein
MNAVLRSAAAPARSCSSATPPPLLQKAECSLLFVAS